MSEGREIKITDRRMFTADGELKEEFRFLEEQLASAEAAAGAPPAGQQRPVEVAATAPAAQPPGREAAATAAAAAAEPPGRSPAGEEPPPGGPGFLDLVGMLAEPASLYLGDIPLPDGRHGEDLEMARLHIDLLETLQRKTTGNLTAQESAVLDDVIYQLRMRYVQKSR